MASPSGFAYSQRKNGEVVITHRGKVATVLRRARAAKFLSEIETRDEQEVMARVTGNYKRGNERS